VKRTEFSNDLFTERALRFIEQNQSRPFFLYLPYTIPHANNELTRESGAGMEVPSDEPYTSKPWKQVDKNFAAAITRMDRDIGRVLKLLSELKLDDDTLMLFSSDNGPHNEANHSVAMFESSGPLRGRKRDLYEGGIRVPTIARWTGNIKPAQVSDSVWAFWDFVPTVADIAGARAPSGLDGISITPALNGRPLERRDPLYWEFHERGFDQAVRDHNWKAVRRLNRGAPIELYDMKTDISEKNDVASRHPDVVGRMKQLMESSRRDSPDFPIKERTA
jgi:arylsulfatase A-like enzyme